MNVNACFTGHRPNKLAGYDRENYRLFVDELKDWLVQLTEDCKITHFISGGAQGFDQLAFWAVDKAKREGLAVSNDIFVPFEAQPSRWEDEGLFSKKEYSLMLRMADSVSVIKDGTPEDHKQAAEWLNERNHMMVDSSSIVIALWDRSKGGTGNCVAYANRQNKPIILLSYTLDEKGRLRLI